jgi:hypothetical protein
MKSIGKKRKGKINYRRSTGEAEGYCKDCTNFRIQHRLFHGPLRRCVEIGVTQKKMFEIKPDFTCDLFRKRSEKDV